MPASEGAHPGHVATRSCETGDEAGADRVGRESHDDRDFVGCLHRGADRGFPADHQHVDRQTRELSRESGKTIEASFGAALFELEVAALDISEVA